MLGQCCGGACTDLSFDSANCDACGAACPAGERCLAGLCAGGTSCVPGQNCPLDGGGWGICCGGSCVDGLHDSANCGGCGNGCPSGSGCDLVFQYGQPRAECVNDGGSQITCFSASDCPAGTLCAWGYCVPPSCGASAAFCALDGGSPPDGICCGESCANIDSDPQNCGLCGFACPTGASCVNRQCQINGLSSDCRTTADCSAGTFCLNLACLSPSCPPGDEGFPCAASPTTIGSCCDGRCVDNGDPVDGLGCGAICPSGVLAAGIGCFDGAPSPSCPMSCAPGTACDGKTCVGSVCLGGDGRCLAADQTIGACCGVACANLLTDPSNCGACGVACPAGQLCEMGRCSGSPGCLSGANGLFCKLDAGTSWICCVGTGCTDSSSDPSNCGGCGIACPAGQNCRLGTCG
ncbi:MAG: hypothetical protein ACYCWW_15285 [Deltaproteobacteria bacterium]